MTHWPMLLALAGAAILIYIYAGYRWILGGLVQVGLRSEPIGKPCEAVPFVTVLITVHNEATQIASRIDDVLHCEYPDDRLEVLIASDGSTDSTDDVVLCHSHPAVRLFRPAERHGKTDTQNQAIAHARGEIVVFTDADTRFSPAFLKAIVDPFIDETVGGVDGHLLFRRVEGSGVSESQGIYWSQELAIRELESRLGILAVASGACMAVRRSLFRPMFPGVGEDCQIPLDIVAQGFRMVHAANAIAWDVMPADSSGEFRTRVRMTQRNWQGTWRYPALLNPFARPGIAWALWSHKLLRWLSPLFLLLWCLGSFACLLQGGFAALAGLPAVAFVLGALAGATKLPLRGASVAYSFALANAGFLVGIVKAMAGRSITIYR